MSNNNGFMLYDALLSLILLSAMILFFLTIININLSFENKYNQEIDAIESLRDETYYYAQNGKYYEKSFDDYKLEKGKHGVCAVFYDYEIENICIE